MDRFISRWLHSMAPSLCIKELLNSPTPYLLWKDRTLRCPVCGRLIAYVFPLHGMYELSVSYVFKHFKYNESIIKSLPEIYCKPIVKEPTALIDWELLRAPIEPLISDTWDDDVAYQSCIQSYIQSVRQAENKTSPTSDKSESE